MKRTETIKIHGVKVSHGTSHDVILDRIEAGTLMVAAAVTYDSLLKAVPNTTCH